MDGYSWRNHPSLLGTRILEGISRLGDEETESSDLRKFGERGHSNWL